MIRLTRFCLRKPGSAFVLGIGTVAAMVCFYRATAMDEGEKRHVLKRLSEIYRMPGRLVT